MKRMPEAFDNTFDYEELDLEIHGAKIKRTLIRQRKGLQNGLQVRNPKQNHKQKRRPEIFPAFCYICLCG